MTIYKSEMLRPHQIYLEIALSKTYPAACQQINDISTFKFGYAIEILCHLAIT